MIEKKDVETLREDIDNTMSYLNCSWYEALDYIITNHPDAAQLLDVNQQHLQPEVVRNFLCTVYNVQEQKLNEIIDLYTKEKFSLDLGGFVDLLLKSAGINPLKISAREHCMMSLLSSLMSDPSIGPSVLRRLKILESKARIIIEQKENPTQIEESA